MRRAKGFTLMEVLVAMAITAIAAMIAYSGLDNAVKMAETAELEADRLQKINRVFDIMGKDFRQVIGRPVRNADGDTTDPAFTLDLARQPLLSFTRAGWINPAPERFQRSELQRVSYHLDGSKLIRYSRQMLDAYPDSQFQEIVLLDNVRSFQVKVLSEVAAVNAMGQVVAADQGEWIETWPVNQHLAQAGNAITLPLAVEIIVDLEGWGRIRRVYELVAGTSQ